jgi:hypothetical protein
MPQITIRNERIGPIKPAHIMGKIVFSLLWDWNSNDVLHLCCYLTGSCIFIMSFSKLGYKLSTVSL